MGVLVAVEVVDGCDCTDCGFVIAWTTGLSPDTGAIHKTMERLKYSVPSGFQNALENLERLYGFC